MIQYSLHPCSTLSTIRPDERQQNNNKQTSDLSDQLLPLNKYSSHLLVITISGGEERYRPDPQVRIRTKITLKSGIEPN